MLVFQFSNVYWPYFFVFHFLSPLGSAYVIRFLISATALIRGNTVVQIEEHGAVDMFRESNDNTFAVHENTQCYLTYMTVPTKKLL